MSIADDSNALAAYISNLEGEIVQARTFQFEIPQEEVRKVVPEIYKLGGLRCARVSEESEPIPTTGQPAR
jgi:hypothetical protein